jgi:hypothetical protein
MKQLVSNRPNVQAYAGGNHNQPDGACAIRPTNFPLVHPHVRALNQNCSHGRKVRANCYGVSCSHFFNQHEVLCQIHCKHAVPHARRRDIRQRDRLIACQPACFIVSQRLRFEPKPCALGARSEIGVQVFQLFLPAALNDSLFSDQLAAETAILESFHPSPASLLPDLARRIVLPPIDS